MTANVIGDDVTSINSSNISIVEGTDDYKFTIEATGTLTLKITDTGDSANGGTPVVAAEFYRTDSEGNTYGDLIVSNEQGEVVFNKVPFSAEGDQLFTLNKLIVMVATLLMLMFKVLL